MGRLAGVWFDFEGGAYSSAHNKGCVGDFVTENFRSCMLHSARYLPPRFRPARPFSSSPNAGATERSANGQPVFEIFWYTIFSVIKMSSRNNQKWYGRPIPYHAGPTIRLIFCPPNSPIHGKPLGWLRFGRFLIDRSQEAARP